MDKKDRKKAMDAQATTRLVARMSGRCWKVVEEIFSLYEESRVKGQKKEKAGQLGLPDCKKSYWQFLHNLDEKQQFSLLRPFNRFHQICRGSWKSKCHETGREGKIVLFVLLNIVLYALTLSIIQVLHALEEVYSKPREALPEALTTPRSIRQLDKEVNSRKVKRTISEEFKRKCQGTES